MSSMPTLYNSMSTISIPKIAVVNRYAKINGHGRNVRIPHVAFQPTAVMVDSTSTTSSVKDVRPITTIFKPSMWGHIFSNFSSDEKVQQKYSEEIEVLKKETRSMLMAATSTELLTLIDNLERLGIAYHFEAEIEEKLKQVYDSAEKEGEDYDLCATALRFRLLRQHQYHVSCDAFMKFVDKDSNKLKESLSSDVEGLLSLHEAAHVRIHDENVLEEAIAFTTHHLSRMQTQLESPIKEKVKHALRYPLHKSLGILSLRFHIDSYENDESRDELVLRLAQLNFNFMQNIYMNELYEITTWWNNYDVKSKVPYFRDRLVECYLWGLAYRFEPEYAPIRKLITKYYMTTTTVDDTYDNYATLAEIEVFTQALGRWNRDEIDALPEYIKAVYKCVMDFSEEFEREAEKQGKGYVVPYFIEEMKRATKGYAQEQEWIMKKQMPSFDEYMMNSRVTSLMYVTYVAIVAVIKSATKETIDWVLGDNDLFVYTNDVGRLVDDLASHQRERKDGTVITSMDYYMKEKGVSMEEGESAFRAMIEDKWKSLTEAWVNCTTLPKEIAVQILDLARICGTLYGNEQDEFTYPEETLAPLITALLVDPIII